MEDKGQAEDISKAQGVKNGGLSEYVNCQDMFTAKNCSSQNTGGQANIYLTQGQLHGYATSAAS